MNCKWSDGPHTDCNSMAESARARTSDGLCDQLVTTQRRWAEWADDVHDDTIDAKKDVKLNRMLLVMLNWSRSHNKNDVCSMFPLQ